MWVACNIWCVIILPETLRYWTWEGTRGCYLTSPTVAFSGKGKKIAPRGWVCVGSVTDGGTPGKRCFVGLLVGVSQLPPDRNSQETYPPNTAHVTKTLRMVSFVVKIISVAHCSNNSWVKELSKMGTNRFSWLAPCHHSPWCWNEMKSLRGESSPSWATLIKKVWSKSLSIKGQRLLSIELRFCIKIIQGDISLSTVAPTSQNIIQVTFPGRIAGNCQKRAKIKICNCFDKKPLIV